MFCNESTQFSGSLLPSTIFNVTSPATLSRCFESNIWIMDNGLPWSIFKDYCSWFKWLLLTLSLKDFLLDTLLLSWPESSLNAKVNTITIITFLSFQKKRLGSIWNNKPSNSCPANCTSSSQFTHLSVFFLDPTKSNT